MTEIKAIIQNLLQESNILLEDNLLPEYNLSDTEIERLRKEAIRVAIGCGNYDSHNKLESNDWSLFDKISDSIWYSEKGIPEKINLGFKLYEIFPSYYHFLVPFYRLIYKKETDNQELKNIVWERFIEYLGAESFYADPIAYVLWVDFFEDQTTVKEAWTGLMGYSKNTKSLLRLLECAGPVPFDLKEPIYLELISDETTHQAIFNSILFSAFDVCGQIDKIKAGIILSKLNIHTSTENYLKLREKLK
ncbi:MAG: hypothetical protein A3K10_03615 [Bacteroidetes bacterium RIFCSPLOWO2_12_FULL_31_6]|nr:MAG: hypothetical protein A3K10_03615 [Bacteroidetes bacterium RIFCSPLOWO2_12_FULL_31_6]